MRYFAKKIKLKNILFLESIEIVEKKCYTVQVRHWEKKDMQTKQETTAFISSVQTSLFTPTSCVFTGHRELDEDFNKRKLKKLIE